MMIGRLVFSAGSVPHAVAAILTFGAGAIVLIRARRASLSRPFFAGSPPARPSVAGASLPIRPVARFCQL